MALKTYLAGRQIRVEIEQWRVKHEKDFKADTTKPARIVLVGWLQSFHIGLNSKMGLYFYNIFQRQERELGLDIRGLMTRLEINYPLVLESFCQRVQCKQTLVVFEGAGLARNSLDLDGYACPVHFAVPGSGLPPGASEPPSGLGSVEESYDNEDDQPMMGLKSYPAIFSYPATDPTVHMPSTTPAAHNSFSYFFSPWFRYR